MSRDFRRVDYREFRDDRRDRYRENDRSWGRNDYRDRFQKNAMPMKRRDINRDKQRSRSPRKPDKDLLDDNILSEISKLPSELWDNQIQDGHQNYQPPATNYGQDGTNYGGNYQAQYSGIYDEFTSVNSAPPAPDMSSWNQMSLPPPPTVAPAPVYNMEDQIKKDAAIETEMRHQKAALSKQREDYIKKAGILKKELDTLKDQRNELRGDSKRSPSPDTKRFLKENTKLQLEIQNKLKTINNVVDMLNGIIGEEAAEVPDIEEASERSSKRKSRSPSGNKFNYVYYDPEMHWCRVCNEFPPTAKDYLNHLHSAAHHKMASSHMEAPWHSIVGMNEGFPNHPSAPTKRTPIKGLQFFVPSTAWYCKLCDQFIGDLHCASAHLKSVVHAKNFTNFVEQNPHWETDWMSDRQKAFEKSRAATTEERYTSHTIAFNKDGFQMRRKSQSPEPRRSKKKKKNKRKRASSSSDSDSDSDSEKKKKKEKKEKARLQEEKLSEWMSAVRDGDDRKLIDTIRNRMKIEEATRRREATAVLCSPSRERERRESNSRDDRGRHDERDNRRDERDNRRDERDNRRDERDNRREANVERKKPEIRKMPFIGKMPVYKNLCKTQKTEEQKKEELKKKDEDETKKRQEAMDAEIQKKVAEFKEKIARAQEERAAEQRAEQMAQAALPPAIPPPIMTIPPPTLVTIPPPAAPGTQPQPNLPKDFQDALDIIFPSDVKKDHQQDMFGGVNMNMPPFQMGMGMNPGMNPFPQPGILGEPPMMMGFNAMNPMFPRPQLYDQVPNVPITKPNQNNQKPNQNTNQKRFNNVQQKKKEEKEKEQKNKEELDDLAMLGIDASDVGAGI